MSWITIYFCGTVLLYRQMDGWGGRGADVVKKVRGHLPEPEIQSVTVQIQLDGVHPKCTPHKSQSHTHRPCWKPTYTHTHSPCSTHPHHRWESLFNRTTWACWASVTPPSTPTFYPKTPPSLFWSLILDPDSSTPVLIDWDLCVWVCVCGRHNNIQNKPQTERKWWDHPVALCVINQLSPLTRWLPK